MPRTSFENMTKKESRLLQRKIKRQKQDEKSEKKSDLKMGGVFQNPPSSCSRIIYYKGVAVVDSCICAFSCFSPCTNFINFQATNYTKRRK